MIEKLPPDVQNFLVSSWLVPVDVSSLDVAGALFHEEWLFINSESMSTLHFKYHAEFLKWSESRKFYVSRLSLDASRPEVCSLIESDLICLRKLRHLILDPETEFDEIDMNFLKLVTNDLQSLHISSEEVGAFSNLQPWRSLRKLKIFGFPPKALFEKFIFNVNVWKILHLFLEKFQRKVRNY